MFRVYVGNLPYKVRDQELKEFFEQNCGPVKESVVPLNGDRRSMGFGFVEFEDKESFDKAIAMSGTEMDARPLRIDAARPKEERNNQSTSKPSEESMTSDTEESEAKSDDSASEMASEDEADKSDKSSEESSEDSAVEE